MVVFIGTEMEVGNIKKLSISTRHDSLETAAFAMVRHATLKWLPDH
jgi:hypothetical protein